MICIDDRIIHLVRKREKKTPVTSNWFYTNNSELDKFLRLYTLDSRFYV